METVGQRLRQVREEKGLSIKDIEGETSIRALYIKAIEDDDYATVPGEVYLKGFLRNYAGHLGLDPQEILEMYRAANAPQPEPVAQVQEPAEPVARETVQPVLSREYERAAESPTQRRDSSSGWKWIAIGGLAVVGLVGGIFWWQMNDAPAAKPPVAAALPAKTTEKTPSAPAVSTPPPATKDTVAIAAKFMGNCWTSVMVDGKTVYEGIPKSGESMNWEGRKDIVIKAGNAAAIEITKNGQPIGKLGNAGEVVEKKFAVGQ